MGDMETLRLRVHAKVTKDFNCWNCWSTQHDASRCKKRRNSLLERELLRIGWKQPLPQDPRYLELLNRVRVCFNCWESDRHGPVQCQKPRRSIMEREKKRVHVGFPLLNSWKAELDRVGISPMEKKEEKPVPIGGEGWGEGWDPLPAQELPKAKALTYKTEPQSPKVAGADPIQAHSSSFRTIPTPSSKVLEPTRSASQLPKDTTTKVEQTAPPKMPQALGSLPTNAPSSNKATPEKTSGAVGQTVKPRVLSNDIPAKSSSVTGTVAPPPNIFDASKSDKENTPTKLEDNIHGNSASPEVGGTVTNSKGLPGAKKSADAFLEKDKEGLKIKDTDKPQLAIVTDVAAHNEEETTEVSPQSSTDSPDVVIVFKGPPIDEITNNKSSSAPEDSPAEPPKPISKIDEGNSSESEVEGGVKIGLQHRRVKSHISAKVDEDTQDDKIKSESSDEEVERVVAKGAADQEVVSGITSQDAVPIIGNKVAIPVEAIQTNILDPVYTELPEPTLEIPRELSTVGSSINHNNILTLEPQQSQELLKFINTHNTQLTHSNSGPSTSNETYLYTIDPIKFMIKQQDEANKKVELIYNDLNNKLSAISKNIHINSTVLKHLAPEQDEMIRLEHQKQLIGQHQFFIQQQQMMIEQKDSVIGEQGRFLEYKTRVISELERKLHEQGQMLQEKEKKLQEQGSKLFEKEKKLQEKELVLEWQRKMIQQKDNTFEEQRKSLEKNKIDMEDQRKSLQKNKIDMEEQRESLEKNKINMEEQRKNLEDNKKEIEEQRISIEKYKKEVEELQSSLKRSAEIIEQQEQAIQAKDTTIKQYEEVIQLKDATLKHQQLSIEQKDTKIESHQALLTSNKAVLQRNAKVIEELQKNIQQKDLTLKAQQTIILQKDKDLESHKEALEDNAKTIEKLQRKLDKNTDLLSNLNSPRAPSTRGNVSEIGTPVSRVRSVVEPHQSESRRRNRGSAYGVVTG